MNRSIFSIWKQFNFNLFFINLIFTLLLYFLGFIGGGFISCDDLVKIVYNNFTIRYSPTLSSIRLYRSLEFLQHYILNTPESNFKFNMCKYLQLNGQRFPRNHVYDHYHINLYLDNMHSVHYGFSLTRHPENLNLLLNEFKEFSESNFFGEKQTQYILNDLKIYDLEFLKIQNDTNIFKNFILKNNEKCIFQFKNFFNKK